MDPRAYQGLPTAEELAELYARRMVPSGDYLWRGRSIPMPPPSSIGNEIRGPLSEFLFSPEMQPPRTVPGPRGLQWQPPTFPEPTQKFPALREGRPPLPSQMELRLGQLAEKIAMLPQGPRLLQGLLGLAKAAPYAAKGMNLYGLADLTTASSDPGVLRQRGLLPKMDTMAEQRRIESMGRR